METFYATFTGTNESDKGTIHVSPNENADTQVWTLTATSGTTFSVFGSRCGAVGTLIVDVEFESDDGRITIFPGTIPYDIGDTYTFSIRGWVFPRYVKKDSNGQIINFPGGPAADTNNEGTWLVSRRMYENVSRTLEHEFPFADLLEHNRSIIKAQDGFTGSSFGINNYRDLDHNLGYGGIIREYDSNFPLLASSLIQRDMSPLTVIDFAESQYATALSSIDTFLVNELAKFIASTRSMDVASISTSDPHIVALFNYFEELRSINEQLKTVYKDTTSGIKGWPITLPMMGLVPAVAPTFTFDNELGLTVLVHHDGHVSPITTTNEAFERSMALTIVERSTGVKTPGTIAVSAPSNPYARQLWFNSSTLNLSVFDVISDGDTPPTTGATGDYWYRRSDQTIFEWVAGFWIPSAATMSSLWEVVDTSTIRNSLLLTIEQKLYAAVHPSTIVKYTLSNFAGLTDAEIELAKYSAKYNYDTFAPDYDAADAFTWNYSSAVIAGVPAGTARWHNVYKEYFDQSPTVLSTCRPNLEPWKLLGYATKMAANTGLSIDWDALYADVTSTRLWNNAMWTFIAAARPGLKLCVNTTTDELLPPYVNVSHPFSANALLTAIPAGVSNTYTFGQDGPVETVWKKSLEYFYGLARVAFKQEPLRFLDKVWGETYFQANTNLIRVERNLMRPLAPSLLLLHGEKLHIINERDAAYHVTGTYSSAAGSTLKAVVSHVEDNATWFHIYSNDVLVGTVAEGASFSITDGGNTFTGVTITDRGIPFSLDDTFLFTETEVTFTPAQSKKLLGLGQIFTNLLRFNAIDTDMSESLNAFRGWDVRLVHRIGALIRGDSLKISAAGISPLPDTAYSVVLKRSTSIDSKWISALRVQLVQAGTRVLAPNGNNVPVGDASDWVFRVETYNPQNPLVERYTLDTAAEFQTFNALSKASTDLAFKRYTEHLALVKSTTPTNITGLQNTLNFIYGYIDRLEEQGWTVNAGERIITDDETGRNLDWQLEVEKLVDRVYRGLLPGEGHILNPFMHGLWLMTPTGLMSRYSEKSFLDVASVQAVFDVAGSAIPIPDIQVIRTDDSTVTYSDTPIFSAHAFLDEFEHVILFSNKVSDEDNSTTLYNPFLGLRITTANMSYTRQEEVDRKPRFHGFVLVGNDVKRNIVSSIDAIANYYDPTRTFAEPTTANHALSLLGFNKKDYFTDINTSDATQFNFWRGLIQAKGTNMTIDAFVNYKKFTDASVDEYWAYKLAEYGDNRARAFPEVKIEVSDALQNFTQLQFYDATDVDYVPLPLFEQIENDDDARWYTIEDLGKGVSFPADKIEAVLNGTAVGYYRLQDIFHNGDDGAPQVYLRTTVKNSSGEVLSVVDTLATTATIINATLVKVTVALTPPALTTYEYVVKGYTWRNFTKLAPIKLFNYQESALVKEVALWHPAIGVHAYEPLDVINSINAKDPALYNTTIQTADNPNYVFTKPWGKREVGRVWWDTSNLGYIPYYDATIFPDRNERNARWGNLADWASVDIYEWVESDVPPEEYDALALDQEGQSDIHPSIKASGKSALKNYYERERIITMRPIAWSKAGTPNAVAHPSFPSSSTKVFASSGALFADAFRAEEAGLTADRRFSAWKSNKPYGEAIIGTDLVYDLGSSLTLGTPQLIASGFVTSIEVRAIPNGRIGTTIGQITLTDRLIQVNTSTYVQMLRMSDSAGYYEDVVVEDWLANSENDMTIQFADFGIEIAISRAATTSAISASDIVLDVITSCIDLYIREGARYTVVIPLPDTVFVNDTTSFDFFDYDYGWKAWDIPMQSDLNSDLLFPRNTWQPYLGDAVTVDASPDIIAEMREDGLTLKNGITINRFTSSWTEWQLMKDTRIDKIANGTATVSFDRSEFLTSDEELNSKRISVYANGLQVSPKNYIISGAVGAESIELISIPAEGTNVLFIYRARQLTEEELAFDSSVEDNPEFQHEYKASYQYTKTDVRSESGAIVGAKYYFWVEDSTVTRPGKSISLAQAKSLLTSGPSQFVAFAKLDERKDSFDSCVIAGLNMYVTNNDTYKLRFVHNETLRDDPEQISLRNVHTEWVLLKKSQNSKIPSSLWEHLTNAAAGQDLNGNTLPSPVRADYDARNGTRSSFGFSSGQILADTELVRATIKNTILNTSLEIRISGSTIPDYITALNFDDADDWFKDASSARATMDLIWSSARARQINEIFFAVLEDALANNYEFTDIFKTSLISVQTTSAIEEQVEAELEDGKF